MKKYFAKYLPIKGEIKDCLWIAKENLGLLPPMRTRFGMSFTEEEAKDRNLLKVKLFLCSKNIQVGDKVYHTFMESITKEHQPELVEDVEDLEHLQKYNAFKVIGEILTPGIKEGQEFTEEEIDYLTIR